MCLWLKFLVVKFVALYSKYTHKSICKNPKWIHDFVYFMWFRITYSIEFKTQFLFASCRFGSKLNSWNFQFDMGLFSCFMVNTILIESIFKRKLNNIIFCPIQLYVVFLIILIKYVNVNHNHFIKMNIKSNTTKVCGFERRRWWGWWANNKAQHGMGG